MNKAEYQEESALSIQGGLGDLATKAKNVWKLLVLPGLTCPRHSCGGQRAPGHTASPTKKLIITS